MNGDIHVRVCESLKGKFLLATRPDIYASCCAQRTNAYMLAQGVRMTTVPPIVQHIESNLERILENGIARTIEIDAQKIHLLKFYDQPFDGVTTICTCGLSKHIFTSSMGNISQELLFGYFSVYESANWLPIVAVLCEDLIKSHKAFELGQLYKVSAKLFPNNNTAALYCSYPMFYGNEIWECDKTYPSTYFIWLFPITNEEVEYIEKYGAERFEEDKLMIQKPRLFDFKRASLKL
jgi:hypothetical protein